MTVATRRRLWSRVAFVLIVPLVWQLGAQAPVRAAAAERPPTRVALPTLAEETHIPIGPASLEQILYVVGLIQQGR